MLLLTYAIQYLAGRRGKLDISQYPNLRPLVHGIKPFVIDSGASQQSMSTSTTIGLTGSAASKDNNNNN